MAYRHKADTNQTAIVKTLRSIPGVTVEILNGTIDICVGYKGKNYLFEIKRDKFAKMRDSQVKFFSEWQGQIMRVECVDEILHKLELVRIGGQWRHSPSTTVLSMGRGL
jgi:hypothetical protein